MKPHPAIETFSSPSKTAAPAGGLAPRVESLGCCVESAEYVTEPKRVSRKTVDRTGGRIDDISPERRARGSTTPLSLRPICKHSQACQCNLMEHEHKESDPAPADRSPAGLLPHPANAKGATMCQTDGPEQQPSIGTVGPTTEDTGLWPAPRGYRRLRPPTLRRQNRQSRSASEGLSRRSSEPAEETSFPPTRPGEIASPPLACGRHDPQDHRGDQPAQFVGRASAVARCKRSSIARSAPRRPASGSSIAYTPNFRSTSKISLLKSSKADLHRSDPASR